MLHLMKYRCKSILRDKTTIFWTFVFPFILGTLFYLTFGSMDNNLDCINTAVVVQDDSEHATMLKTVLEEIEDSEDDLIKVEEMSEKEAKKQLKNKKITGIFFAGKECQLMVSDNGTEESVLQAILEQFQSRMNMMERVQKEKPEKLAVFAESILNSSEVSCVKETNLGGKKTHGVIQYFFALVAMTCLFGGFMGMDVSLKLQANVESLGARRNVSATGKIKMILSDICMIVLVESVILLGLLVFIKMVLKQDIGNNWPGMFAISFLGSLIGIAVGVLVGCMSKLSEGVKIGILSAFGTFSGFLSGLMVGGIKGLLEQYCPVVNRLNPASLITDAFYSISMYPDRERFVRDMVIMAIMAATIMLAAFAKMRRVQYDSI